MEDVLELKREWIVKCLNCGHDAHDGILYRKEVGHPVDGSNEYQIEVCRHCRYEDEAA